MFKRNTSQYPFEYRLLADECVNADVILGLRESGFDVLTAREAGLTGCDDDAIFAFALKNKRILLSFDRGFGDIFRFNISKSSGVIVVLVGQMSKSEIVTIILSFLVVMNPPTRLRGTLAILGKTRIRLIKR